MERTVDFGKAIAPFLVRGGTVSEDDGTVRYSNPVICQTFTEIVLESKKFDELDYDFCDTRDDLGRLVSFSNCGSDIEY